jgi:hypothetical protein
MTSHHTRDSGSDKRTNEKKLIHAHDPKHGCDGPTRVQQVVTQLASSVHAEREKDKQELLFGDRGLHEQQTAFSIY